MTRDGTVGRSDGTERNLPLHWDIDPARVMRPRFADSIRASSPSGLRETGRTHDCKRLLCGTLHFLLPGGGHPHMKRREFIILLAGTAAVAWPLAVEAQQAGTRRIGLLETGAASPARVQLWETLRQRLRQLGYLEGQNIAFESRFAEGKSDRLSGI